MHSGIEIRTRSIGVESPLFFLLIDWITPQHIAHDSFLRNLSETVQFLNLL